MLFGSPYVHVDSAKDGAKAHITSDAKETSKRVVATATTNVVIAALECLEKSGPFSTGDPLSCAKCKAIFNKFSKTSVGGGVEAKAEVAPGGPEPGPAARNWCCEFCNHVNEWLTEADVFAQPTQEQQDFLLAPAPKEDETKGEDDSMVLFVIDTSGSMSQSQKVKSFKRPQRGKASPDDATIVAPDKPPASAASSSSLSSKFSSLFSSFSASNKAGPAKQAAPKGDPEYVSRLEFVQAAVDVQLEMMRKEYPKRRVGLISFSSDVKYWGDGSQPKPTIFSGDVLQSYESLMEKGADLKIDTPIAKSRFDMQGVLLDFTDNGSTALGPALVLAAAIASQKPGSKVILCTDGCANVGVGDLSAAQKAQDFYQQVAHVAKRKGVIVSVISIKGAETKLEFVGNVADITRGTVDLVDPAAIDFGGLLSGKVLASNCTVSIYLSPALALNKFAHDDTAAAAPDSGAGAGAGGDGVDVAAVVLPANRDVRDVGNVTRDTQITYEFHTTLAGVDLLLKQLEANKQAGVAFQLQIDYSKIDGARCKRVVSTSRPLTTDVAVARDQLDIKVVSANLAQQCAWLAKGGDYEGALQYARDVKTMIEARVRTDEDRALLAMVAQEYRDIEGSLQAEIQKEKSNVSDVDDVVSWRANQRVDQTSKQLYSYKQSKAEACVVQ